MGAHYRHTTPEMAARVVTAIQARLTVVVHAAEDTLEAEPTHLSRCVFRRLWTVLQANPWQMAVRSLRSMQGPGAGPGLGCWFVVEPPAGIEPATPSLPFVLPGTYSKAAAGQRTG
jgi:hypothetical protein